MKKFRFGVSSLLFVALIFSVLPISSANSNESEVTLFKADPITDVNLLLERAKQGINDRTVNNSLNESKSLAKSNNTIDPKLGLNSPEYYSTTQKILSVQKGETVVDTYNTTSFAVAADSKSQQKPDSSGGVVAYSTVQYQTQYKNNLTHYKVTSVSGGWTVNDKQIRLSDRTVIFGCSGNSLEGGFAVTQSKGPYSIASNSFSYSAPSNWYYVASPSSTIGVTSTVTLTRGSTTWKLLFPLTL